MKNKLQSILKWLNEIKIEKTIFDHLETVIIYLINSTDVITYDVLQEEVERVLESRGKQIMPTIAEQLIEKGMQQGMLQNSRKNIIDILETRFHLVPIEIQEALNNIYEPDTLNRLVKKAVIVSSLQEFINVIHE